MNIKKGEKVLVHKGESKGKQGKVLKVFPERNMVIVEGCNLIKRHTRPSNKNQQGGIIEKEAPISCSNMKIICPGCGKPVRIKRRRNPEGRLVRHCKSCDEIISTG